MTYIRKYKSIIDIKQIKTYLFNSLTTNHETAKLNLYYVGNCQINKF